MKYRAALLLITTITLASFVTACKTKQPKVKPVEQVKMVEENIDLNIHVRHFKTKQCLQGVSEWVYTQIPEDDKEHFKPEKTFVRHHSHEDVKNGVCDNTVQIVDKKTGAIKYICGGHTLNRR